ncbi:hypothetical protein KCP75_06120 [Salmonella enterica subsp. enterica]|nr:hypothetical protein KCP75_06120 [Salmonella enterica subsp. enterica]
MPSLRLFSLYLDDFRPPTLSVFCGLLPFARLQSSGRIFISWSDCAVQLPIILAVFSMMKLRAKTLACSFNSFLCGTGV